MFTGAAGRTRILVYLSCRNRKLRTMALVNFFISLFFQKLMVLCVGLNKSRRKVVFMFKYVRMLRIFLTRATFLSVMLSFHLHGMESDKGPFEDAVNNMDTLGIEDINFEILEDNLIKAIEEGDTNSVEIYWNKRRLLSSNEANKVAYDRKFSAKILIKAVEKDVANSLKGKKTVEMVRKLVNLGVRDWGLEAYRRAGEEKRSDIQELLLAHSGESVIERLMREDDLKDKITYKLISLFRPSSY